MSHPGLPVMLISPAGKSYRCPSLTAAAKRLGSGYATVQRMLRTGRPCRNAPFRGWRAIRTGSSTMRTPVIAEDPSGELHYFDSVRQAGRSLGVHANVIANRMNEKTAGIAHNSVLRGWVFREVK